MNADPGTVSVELDQIAGYLDALLEVARYTEAHANTLLVGWEEAGRGRKVERVCAAVNTSMAAIAHAERTGAGLLLVHHAAWPQIELHLTGEKEERLREANIALYVAHSALDGAPGIGTGDTLATALGIHVEGRFAPFEGGQGGVHGRVDGTWEAFLERARRTLGTEVRAHRNSDRFGQIALTTGGGGAAFTTVVEEARQLGCDTYLTGESTMFTRLFAHEIGLNLIVGTHYSTEAPGVRNLARLLGERFAIPCEFFEDRDPETAGA